MLVNCMVFWLVTCFCLTIYYCAKEVFMLYSLYSQLWLSFAVSARTQEHQETAKTTQTQAIIRQFSLQESQGTGETWFGRRRGQLVCNRGAQISTSHRPRKFFCIIVLSLSIQFSLLTELCWQTPYFGNIIWRVMAEWLRALDSSSVVWSAECGFESRVVTLAT